MTNKQKPSETIDEMRGMVTKNVEQARKAMSDYMQFMKNSASSTPWAGNEQSKKMIELAEKNVSAMFDFAEQLTSARSPDEFVKIQTDFVQQQMQAFGEQAKNFAEVGMKATADLFKMPGKFGGA